ncbi:SDR family NAD(P)-dependent oxidoreductase [Xylanibacillus composti]|uniref:Glucose-1-dehydrogenase n=1 Tax=Xylanibacillus composti TaxID=1572762 RepID=A0A8J4H3H4_9BACL|nr:SDR family oxidoreductase [Xylanibacillus composti]MDT9726547.1 SDR family NAD(P)-dependent oxidoreductase [Xylanibacillus composti]GIQ68965.1 glucose-1-dehydrogenase [Xylanibacillus composti]
MERKAAIVTGASRGIGRGTALKLAEHGYDLVITHLNEQEEAEAVAEEIVSKHGGRCHIVQCDLSESGSARNVMEQAVRAYGRIHVLVNNAGASKFDEIKKMPLDVLNYLMKLNFRAPMQMIQLVSNHMIEHGIAGAIVNIASSRAERAYPTDAIYGGMKAALVRATESIALELAPHGIRINNISPGAIQVRDEMQPFYEALGKKIPLGRGGVPSDVGSAVVWICSEEASYITGVNLRVDGGLILPGMPERLDVNPEDGWGKI